MVVKEAVGLSPMAFLLFITLCYYCYYMKRIISCILFALSMSSIVKAQTTSPFVCVLDNADYDIVLTLDLDSQNISVPNHDLFGPLGGYLSKKRNSFYWLVVSSEVNGNKAILTLVNDYGSEDIEASLTKKNDSTYIFKQLDGSPLKVPNNGKWQKLPKVMEFKKRQNATHIR